MLCSFAFCSIAFCSSFRAAAKSLPSLPLSRRLSRAFCSFAFCSIAFCSSFRAAAKSLPSLPPSSTSPSAPSAPPSARCQIPTLPPPWIHIPLPPPSSPSSSPNPTPSLPSSSPEKPPDCSPSPTAGSPSSALLRPPPHIPIRPPLPLLPPPSPAPPSPLFPSPAASSAPPILPLHQFILKGTPFVAALCPDGPDIFFCNVAAIGVNPVWRSSDTSSCFPQGDFACHKGRLFVINRKTEVTSGFELESGEKDVEVEGVGGVGDGGRVGNFYLVEWTAKGELLLVLKGELNNGMMFVLFRLEEKEEVDGLVKWVGIDRFEES